VFENVGDERALVARRAEVIHTGYHDGEFVVLGAARYRC